MSGEDKVIKDMQAAIEAIAKTQQDQGADIRLIKSDVESIKTDLRSILFAVRRR